MLLVEDDPEISEPTGELLREKGYEVLVAENGRTALEILRGGGKRADIIILDLRMPVMDGWEFRAAQKKDFGLASIPVIAVSGDESAKAEAIAADAYLHKPLKSAILLETVSRVLADAERRNLLGRVEEAERFAALGRLAASVGHEINNPLAFVSMNVELANEQLALLLKPSAVGAEMDAARMQPRLALLQEMMDDLGVGVDRIRNIVKDLQSLSRTHAAQTSVFALNDLLDETLAMVRYTLEHRATVVRKYDVLRPFAGDRSALGQVFLNLLLNAAQAVPVGHAQANAITVTTSQADGECRVEIGDTGAGIPPSVLPHIFDPFYTTKPIGEGTGLGLAVSHRIVTNHGGRIEVESVVGEGTSVRVRLPVSSPIEGPVPTTTRLRGSPSPIPGQRGRILIIDDEALVGRAIASALTDEYEVVLAAHALDAFARLAARETYDVILCDLIMPELGGREVYERLTAEWPHLARRMVFMTGGAFASEAGDFLERTTQPVLYKPFAASELRALVRTEIDRSRAGSG